MQDGAGMQVRVSDGLLYIGFNVYNLRSITQVSRELRIVGYAGIRLQRISQALPWFIPSFLWILFTSTFGSNEAAPWIVTLTAVVGFAIIAPILQPSRHIFVMALGSGDARVDALASRDPGAIDSAVHLIIEALKYKEDYKVETLVHNVMNIERIGNIDNRGGQVGNRVVIGAKAAPSGRPVGGLE
ncbi:hypothetical protein [Frankia sp. CcI49]|uniref:hypothetical protein n=1 Tax=Frankia sp. CcI49 TaxID=1745382 RepID=UPI001054E52E|nr:hypothetical protein [Frankia sp. CcI49]